MAPFKIIKEAFTDSNGQYDTGYTLWVAGVVVFLVLSCVNYNHFDAQQFGIGLAAVLAAGGAMTWMRNKGGVTQ